jgi:hypothetical protein
VIRGSCYRATFEAIEVRALLAYLAAETGRSHSRKALADQD